MPSIENKGLCRYEDKYFTTGIGKVSFSVQYHDFMVLSRMSDAELEGTIRSAADMLAARIRSNAPKKTGDLRRGIITNKEKSKNPGKIVSDVIFDSSMNDTFVKYSKSGKRYYYPASQEYGFHINRAPSSMANSLLTKKVGNHYEWRRGVLTSHGYAHRVPGLYFMRDTAIAFWSELFTRVEKAILKVLEDS